MFKNIAQSKQFTRHWQAQQRFQWIQQQGQQGQQQQVDVPSSRRCSQRWQRLQKRFAIAWSPRWCIQAMACPWQRPTNPPKWPRPWCRPGNSRSKWWSKWRTSRALVRCKGKHNGSHGWSIVPRTSNRTWKAHSNDVPWKLKEKIKQLYNRLNLINQCKAVNKSAYPSTTNPCSCGFRPGK